MTRTIKLLACVLLVVVVLWACAGGVYDETTAATETTETTATTMEVMRPEGIETPVRRDSDLSEIILLDWNRWRTVRYPIEKWDDEPNWVVMTEEGGGNFYVVFDHNGDEITRGYFWRDPSFTMVNENLLKMRVGAGTNNAHIIQFYDLTLGIYSPKYSSPYGYGHGMVFHAEWLSDEQRSQCVTHDMFDPEKNRTILTFDFWRGNWEDLSPDIAEEMIGRWMTAGMRFRVAEFISPTQLRVEYFHVSGEFVSRTITLS
jgi:hypothetical protein